MVWGVSHSAMTHSGVSLVAGHQSKWERGELSEEARGSMPSRAASRPVVGGPLGACAVGGCGEAERRALLMRLGVAAATAAGSSAGGPTALFGNPAPCRRAVG